MLDIEVNLTPDIGSPPPVDETREWPVPATDPPITIPGINADGSQYPVEKIKAHIHGLHHQAISVFIFCKDKLLIQRRALSKYHCGGLWANTCCTHPHFGESPEDAAMRRLGEELGFQTSVEERLIVEYSANVGGGLWERERVHMFRADVSTHDVNVIPNPQEVCEAKWVSGKWLLADIGNNPDQYTPWFRLYVNHFPELNF